jgi:hypothetical protein
MVIEVKASMVWSKKEPFQPVGFDIAGLAEQVPPGKCEMLRKDA